ncbi:SUMF1/EgtB/PvdO family nonheme iron enzyme [Rhodoglobus sp. NPDC076762]
MIDIDEAATNTLNPLVPRAIDLPTEMPIDGALDPEVGDIAKIFAAPSDPADWPAWRQALTAWRDEARARLNYDGSAYDRSPWTRSAYSVAQIWLWDERLFDHEQQQFTIDRFLEETAHLGGFDGIVLWHAYPIIGIDDRNQFDFYRDVPGLHELVADFQSRGIRIFVDYNPWDTGTRPVEHSTELTALVRELGADGVFLDTMKEANPELTSALPVLEGESRVPNQRIEDHLLSWAQWFADSEAPGIMRAHWYERRHMMHSTRRWNRDHSSELQSAFMNGTGILVWDDVFGVWVGWNKRDASTLRTMLRIQRALSDVFVDGEWTPLTSAPAPDVYVSTWQHDGLTLFTAVNRGTSDAVWEIEGFDLGAGRADVSSVTIPARGIAAALQLDGDEPAWLRPLLGEAAADPHESDSEFPARANLRLSVATSESSAPATEHVIVPAGEHTLPVTFRRRETGSYHGAPYVEEWKPLPPRLHDDRAEFVDVVIGNVAVAIREVTASEYAEFAGAPSDHDGPAIGLTLAEARAYAQSVGARLPTEFEWQLAAASDRFERSTPAVWNWTESEHSDGITRFVMLKGGSDHEAIGSDWYTDGGVRPPEFSLKYLLAGLGVEASPTIGFRLAWDLS